MKNDFLNERISPGSWILGLGARFHSNIGPWAVGRGPQIVPSSQRSELYSVAQRLWTVDFGLWTPDSVVLSIYTLHILYEWYSMYIIREVCVDRCYEILRTDCDLALSSRLMSVFMQ